MFGDIIVKNVRAQGINAKTKFKVVSRTGGFVSDGGQFFWPREGEVRGTATQLEYNPECNCKRARLRFEKGV